MPNYPIASPGLSAIASAGNSYLDERERSREWQYKKSLLDLQRAESQRRMTATEMAARQQQQALSMQQLNTLMAFSSLDKGVQAPIAGTPAFQGALGSSAGAAGAVAAGENWAQKRRRVASMVEIGTDQADIPPEDQALYASLSRMKGANPDVFNMFVTGMPQLAGSFRQPTLTPLQEEEQRAFQGDPTARSNVEWYYGQRGSSDPMKQIMANMMDPGGIYRGGARTGGVQPEGGAAPAATPGPADPADFQRTLSAFRSAVQRDDLAGAKRLAVSLEQLSRGLLGDKERDELLSGVYDAVSRMDRGQHPEPIPDVSAGGLPAGGGEGIPQPLSPNPIPGLSPQDMAGINSLGAPQQAGFIDPRRAMVATGQAMGQGLGWARDRIRNQAAPPPPGSW